MVQYHFHIQCVQIIMYKSVMDNKYISCYCDDCISVVNHSLNIAGRMNDLERTISEYKASTSDMLKKLRI